MCLCLLRQHLLYRAAIVMRDGQWLAVVVVFGVLRIDSECVEPRVEHVADVPGLRGYPGSGVAGGTDSDAAFETAAGHGE